MCFLVRSMGFGDDPNSLSCQFFQNLSSYPDYRWSPNFGWTTISPGLAPLAVPNMVDRQSRQNIPAALYTRQHSSNFMPPNYTPSPAPHALPTQDQPKPIVPIV